jgi:hypothetical protein
MTMRHTLILEVIAGGLIAALLLTLDAGARGLGLLGGIVLWWGACVTLWSGALALRLAGATALPGALLLTVPVGAALVSHALLFATRLAGISAGTSFLAWGTAVTLLTLVLRRRERTAVSCLGELCLVALCCAEAAAWTLPTSHAAHAMRVTGYFPAWVDYFIHAGEIASFMGPPAIGRGLISLVDVPEPLYHFASYTLPAAMAHFTGATPLYAALSSWLGISFLSLMTGAAAMGYALGGFPVAVVGVAILAAMPDASYYGLRDSFLGFHWMLITAPGSGYAIGTAMASLALLIGWVRERGLGLLAASAALAAAVFMLRVHVFLLFAPTWVMVVLLVKPTLRRLAVTSVIVIAGLAIFLGPVFIGACRLCGYFQYDLNVGPYLKLVLGNAAAFTHPGFFRTLAKHGVPDSPLGGIALLLVAAFGVPLLVYLIYWIVAILRRRCNVVASVPVLLVAVFIGVTIFAPTPWGGDYTELKQRGFVFVYAILALWSAFAIVSVIAACRPSRAIMAGLLCIAATAGVVIPARFAPALSQPRFTWSGQFFNTPVDRQLVAVGDRLRSEMRPDDVFAIDQPNVKESLAEDATRLSAITGIPVFVSRAAILSSRDSAMASVVRHRLDELVHLERETDVLAARAQLRRLGLRWFLVGGGRTPDWDPERQNIDFRYGEWLVYRTD